MIRALFVDEGFFCPDNSSFIGKCGTAGLMILEKSDPVKSDFLPDECLVLTSSLEKIRHSVACGCRAAGLLPSVVLQDGATPSDCLMAGADWTFSSFSELCDFKDFASFQELCAKRTKDSYSSSFIGALIEEASLVLKNAYVPFSGFRVGAAVLSERNVVYCGCNVENSSYGATICAERNAATTAISCEGKTSFKAIAIASESEEPATPCGICRQFLTEFMDKDAQVYLVSLKSNIIRHYNFGSIMPMGFRL